MARRNEAETPKKPGCLSSLGGCAVSVVLFGFCLFGLFAPRPGGDTVTDQQPNRRITFSEPTAPFQKPFNVSDLVQVTIGEEASIGPVRWRDNNDELVSGGRYILLSVEYQSLRPKLQTFWPWSNQRGIASPHPAALKADSGEKCKQVDFGDKTIVGTNLGIGPRRSQIPLHGDGGRFRDLLVFEVPKEKVEFLELDLPSQALGLTGWNTISIRVRIPFAELTTEP